MARTDDGGPAFPTLDCFVDQKGERPVYAHDAGMSLRDYFAAAALPAIMAEYARQHVANPEGCPSAFYWSAIARDTYAQADALLAERSRGGKS